MFKLTRIYSDNNGDSRFEELAIPLVDKGLIGFLSEKEKVQSIIFREVKEDYDYAFHNAPQRQYIALLDGKIEMETSLGEKRTFNAGDVLLVEDTSGKGHRSKNIETKVRRSLFITLE